MKSFSLQLKFISVKILFGCFMLLFTLSAFAQVGGTWASISSLPANGRAAAVQFVIDKTAYIGTGLNFAGGSGLKDFWAYDPENDVWTQLSDFGGGKRSGAVAFVIAGKGYVMTGFGANQKKNDLWEYDPALDSWTQKTSLPADARNYAVAITIGSKGYLGTGFTNSSQSLSDFWQYDPVNDSWTQKADVPGLARSSAIGFSIDGNGYLGTGFTVNQVNDFYKYDTLTDTWTELSSVGTDARSDAAAFVINGHGYVCSGTGITENLHDLLEYNPIDDSWTPRAPLPGSSKSSAVAFAINGKGYFGSGSDELFNQTTDFYEYKPDTGVATSANLVSANQSLQILPDPITEQGMIILQSNEDATEMKAELFSEEGQEISPSHILKKTAGDHQVNFLFNRDELPDGIYLVFVKRENQILASGKIILQ